MDALATDPIAAAILLAATAAGDADARLAALDPALRARVEAVTAATQAARDRSREAAVQALVAAIGPRVSPSSPAPARAKAIVASLAPREVGAAWMRAAGAPRAGFRASAALRTTLVCTEDDAWRV